MRGSRGGGAAAAAARPRALRIGVNLDRHAVVVDYSTTRDGAPVKRRRFMPVAGESVDEIVEDLRARHAEYLADVPDANLERVAAWYLDQTAGPFSPRDHVADINTAAVASGSGGVRKKAFSTALGGASGGDGGSSSGARRLSGGSGGGYSDNRGSGGGGDRMSGGGRGAAAAAAPPPPTSVQLAEIAEKDVDLNKYDDDALAAVKEAMELEFEKRRKAAGSQGFEYDVKKAFTPVEESGWDDSDED